jgi:RNA polymerase sigma-32 factor
MSSEKSSTQVAKTTKTEVHKSDLLNMYLAEIRRYPLLSAEEERELAIRYLNDQDEEAGRRLITSNLRLVVKMAFKYHSQWSNVLDLIQQGNIGLLQALNKYDPFNPACTRFSSYAAYWIRSCIYNYIKDNYRIVRLGSTRHGRKLFDNLRKEKERLISQGITPSTKALSDSLSIPEEEIIDFSLHFSTPALSLDTPYNPEDKRSLEESVPSDKFASPEQQASDNEIGNLVRERLAMFATTLRDDREEAIWFKRMVAEDPMSLKDLGLRFSVSKERIRQVEKRLKNRLKDFLQHELGDRVDFDIATVP